MSYEAFLRFLADGPKRAPRLYGGGVVHPPAPEATKAPPAVPVAEPVKDGKAAAAGETDEAWDGVEEEPQ